MKDWFKWFRFTWIFSFICLIVFFANQSMIDYTDCCIYYNGFIPKDFQIFPIFFFFIFSLVSLGAELEYGLERSKVKGV